MSKHEVEYMRLRDIIVMIDDVASDPWYKAIRITIPGLQEAIDRDDEDADFSEADEIEEAYRKKHGRDWYKVSWPDHVTFPRFNSDASYQPQ